MLPCVEACVCVCVCVCVCTNFHNKHRCGPEFCYLLPQILNLSQQSSHVINMYFTSGKDILSVFSCKCTI